MNFERQPQGDVPLCLELHAVGSGESVEIGAGLVVDAPPAGVVDTPARMRLASGRRAEFVRREGDDVLTVSGTDGRVELCVRFTASGPILSFEAAGIRLGSPGEVTVACKRFRVEASESVEIRSAGALDAEAQGEATVRAGETARMEGHAVEVRSRRGDVDIKANDDVRLHGERIKLNC